MCAFQMGRAFDCPGNCAIKRYSIGGAIVMRLSMRLVVFYIKER